LFAQECIEKVATAMAVGVVTGRPCFWAAVKEVGGRLRPVVIVRTGELLSCHE